MKNYSLTSYFLIAVSTRENLELCRKYSLAGFPSSIMGAWAFCDIRQGDRVSFLYGARVYDLYIVMEKYLEYDEKAPPPWKPLEFGSGKRRRRYFYPFRLRLKPLRIFNEPLTRIEFSYVAENLLLRGGYRKTHFQADRIDLGYASKLGVVVDNADIQDSINSSSSSELKFTFNKSKVDLPKIFPFREQILHAALRHYLSDEKKLEQFLTGLSIILSQETQWEVLGEKALPEGYVDILIKEAVPTGLSRKIIVEVKRGEATTRDFQQLKAYRKEFGEECIGAVLIAKRINKKLRRKFPEIKVVEYSMEGLADVFTFRELVNAIKIHMPE
ncbi:MAG: hypothetical protein QXO74_01945 [Candidatus Methanomethylicia archaeon]